MSDWARPGEANEALEQFERNLANRLRQMSPPPPELKARGLALIRAVGNRSYVHGSALNGDGGHPAAHQSRARGGR